MSTATPTLILAIPGTQETQERSRTSVIKAIHRGEVKQDQWVWSPTHNDWKQVAEIPELQVKPKVVKMSMPVAATPNAPRAGQQMAPTRFSQPMEIKHEFPFFKVFVVILFLAVAGVIGTNYVMVDQPLATKLASTSFASARAYAHLGAFVEPNALVIHLLPTKEVTADNFADYLTALAVSTPSQPFKQEAFGVVGLTAAWQSQYVFSGADWQKLGQMANASGEARQAFVLDHMESANGAPLVTNRQTDDDATVAAHRASAWQALVANFVPGTP